MAKKDRKQIRKWHKIIEESGKFDKVYYLKQNPDVRKSWDDPIEHYLLYGAEEGRDPNAWFDSDFYLSMYSDVGESGINPFVHYLLYGVQEGRVCKQDAVKNENKTLETGEWMQTEPVGREWTEAEKELYRIIDDSGLFDEQWYLDTYEEARRDPRGGLEYYIEIGQYRGDNPTEWFDVAYYMETYTDVRKSGQNPFVHYILYGKDEGRLPKASKKTAESETVFGREWTEEEIESYRIINESGLFDEKWYLDTYEEAKKDSRGALEHYIEIGQYRGDNPTKWFDAAYYMQRYPDVKESGYNPLAHYILLGNQEERLCKAEQIKQMGHGYMCEIEKINEKIIEGKIVDINKMNKLLKIDLFINKKKRGSFETKKPYEREGGTHIGKFSVKLNENWLQKGENIIDFKIDGVTIGTSTIINHGFYKEFSEDSIVKASSKELSVKTGNQKETLHKDLKIRGGLNSINDDSISINGWLASLVEKDSSRFAILQFDNVERYEVKTSIFRSDLSKIGLTTGKHGFSFQIPKKYFDKKEHIVELIDKETGRKVAFKKFRLNPKVNFHDFDEMLKYNFLDPIIHGPFDENKKRALAFCDVIAKNMEAKALKTQKIKVSVLMAVFNREAIVKKAIYSVLEQTYKNFELIIIDDGSTDNTVEEILAFDDQRIKFIKLDTNKGKSAAINIGLQRATGEWIAYLDSDNTWNKRYLAAMVASIESQNNNIDAIYSGQLLFRGDSNTPYAARLCPYNKNLLFNRNYIDHNSFMHTLEIVKKIGLYDETLRRTLDYDYILRIAEQGVMVSVPLLLTNYYYDAVDNSITNTHHLNKDVIKVQKKAEAKLLDPEWTKKVKYRFEVKEYPVNRMSIVIPNYESHDEIKNCIESLQALDEYKYIEIIVVDNNSSEEVIELLKMYEKNNAIKLILNDENYGFTYAVNQGIAIADENNDIILLNNDAEVINGSLALLSKFSNFLPDAGLLVPAQILYPNTKTMNVHVPYLNAYQYGDVNISNHHKNLDKVNIFEDGSYYSIKFAPFFCVYIPRKTLNLLGPLDAELGRHYRSDRLYCNSVREILQQKIYYIPDSRVLHGLQKSTDNLKKTDEESFDIMFKKNWWSENLLEELSYERRSWDV